MAFGNNEFSNNPPPKYDRDNERNRGRYEDSEREDRTYERSRHTDRVRNESYSNFSRNNRENDSRDIGNGSGYSRNSKREDEEMFSSRDTDRYGYNRSQNREDTNGFAKSNGFDERTRQNDSRDEFGGRKPEERPSGHNRQNNYRYDSQDESRRYSNDNGGRNQEGGGFRQDRRGQNDGRRDEYQDRRGEYQNQNRGYHSQNDRYQGGRRNDYHNDRNNYQDRNSGKNGFQRRNHDEGFGERRDDHGFQRRDNDGENRGFQRRDDGRNQYQGRNQGRDQGYQNSGNERFGNGGGEFNNGGGFEPRGFGNNGRSFNNGGGYGRNDERFGGGGGGYDRGGNDLNNSYSGGYGGGMEKPKERAPKEWMPEHDDTEELIRKTQEHVQTLDIHDDRKLEIRNSDLNTQLTSWENSGLHSQILANIAKLNYHHVRPVQAAVIPQIMRGYDVCGQAETSGGKTAAFGLPVVHKILEYPAAERESVGRSSAPYALVLAPTRELAKQIYENLKMYANGTDVQIQLVYGEMNRWDCLTRIQKGCHILVGTCGRIMDYLQKGEVTCKNLKFFILDEADRLLDDLQRGSGTHLSSIVNDQYFIESKDDRQTLLFSATFNKQVEIVARDFMKRLPGQDDVVRIVISQGRVNKRVNLHFIQANNVAEKNAELNKLLSQKKENGRVPRTLVFVEQKQRTDYVAIELGKAGVNAASINGDRPQNIREQTLAKFKKGEIDVLVGTDVCSRGLDIADLDRVINFDVPKGSVESATDTFIHRVGRTGRMKEGHAYTLVNTTESNDCSLCPSFIELLKSLDREDTVPGWMRNVGGGSYGGHRGFGGYETSKPSGFQNSSSSSGFQSAPSSGYQNEASAGTSSGFGSSSFGKSGFGNTPMTKKKEESTNDEEKKDVQEDEEEEDW